MSKGALPAEGPQAPLRVFVVAGEASGDKLGAALMAGLKALCGVDKASGAGVTFMGVGGPLMQAEGMQSLFPMEELSVMGIAEILPKYRHLRARMIQTAEAVLEAKPDVLITIDSPDFGLRVAARVKAASGIRCVHYVAPTVWAWRPGRAAKMARHIDHVLALFPFEPPYMQAAGMECDFVGHPVVSEAVAGPDEVAAFRAAHGLGDHPLLLVLPGSRRGEVSRMGPRFGETLREVLAQRPDLRIVTPTTGNVTELVQQIAADWPQQPLILDPRGQAPGAAMAEKRAAFAACDGALAASGTVALELAAAGTPMVVAYDMGWLSRQIIGRMLLTDRVNLVNLVTDSYAVPEFIGDAAHAPQLAPAMLEVLARPEAQQEAMAACMQALGKGAEAPGLRAARAVLRGLGWG